MSLATTIPALVGLGLVASATPVLLLGAMLSLSHHRHPYRHTLPLLYGTVAAHTLIVVVFMTALFIPLLREIGHTIEDAGSLALRTGHDLLAAYDPVVAVLLALAGISSIIWWRAAGYDPDNSPLQHLLSSKKLSASLLLIGFVRSLTHVAGLAALALAVRLAGAYGPLSPVLLIATVAASTLPYAVLFGTRKFTPTAFKRQRTYFKRLVRTDPRLTTGVILLLIDAYFVYQSIIGL